MKFSATLLALALCISCTFAATCTGTASVAPRANGGSWSDATYNYQVYDVAFSNPGSCPIDSFSIAFSFTPSGSSISDFWNMELENGKWIINAQTLHVSEGPMLPIGYSYPASVGFTLRFLKDFAVAQVSLQYTVMCNSCGSATSAPTQIPSTSGGTTTAIPTSSPTSAPTAPPSGSCSATTLLIARSGSKWNDGINNFQIYDISVTNNGGCALDTIKLQFSISSGAAIIQSWNMLQQGTLWLLGATTLGTANGHWLAPGQTISGASGFTLKFPIASDYVLTVSVSVQSLSCDTSCSSSTTGSTSGPTSAPTMPSSTSGGATSAPTAIPTSPSSQQCRVVANISRDSSIASWHSDGQTYAIYRIYVTNTGICPISALTLSFSPINVISSWNLQSVIGGYSLQNFGPSIGQNGLYNGSGFVLADVAGPISVLSASPTCLPC